MYNGVGGHTLRRRAGTFALGLFLLTALGPFGTYNDLDLPSRLAYWFLAMVGVGGLMELSVFGIQRLETLNKTGEWTKICLAVVLAGIPATFVVIGLEKTFRNHDVSFLGTIRIFSNVALISLIFMFVHFRILADQTNTESFRAADAPSTHIDVTHVEHPADSTYRTQLHRRLPPEIGEEIVSMSMQDHYIEVTTTQGSHLILMRLSDAMVEIQGVDGLQTHRSHWAAVMHLRELGRDGNKHHIQLSDGRRLPVSQTYLEAVQNALRARAHDTV